MPCHSTPQSRRQNQPPPKSFDRALSLLAALLVVAIIMVALY
jgi:hypothetical protein